MLAVFMTVNVLLSNLALSTNICSGSYSGEVQEIQTYRRDWLPAKGRTRLWEPKSLLIEFLGSIQICARTLLKALFTQAPGVRSNRGIPRATLVSSSR
jgi:hypothetical protein